MLNVFNLNAECRFAACRSTTKTIAYLAHSQITLVKSFLTLAPDLRSEANYFTQIQRVMSFIFLHYFYRYTMCWHNKLECFKLEKMSALVLSWRVKK